MRTLILALALLLTSACSRVPVVDATEAAAVVKAAQELMNGFSIGDSIPAERWPTAIRSLNPDSVLLAEEGLYIQTASFFVEAWGLFVPRDPSISLPGRGSDPSYAKMHTSLFSYYVAG